MISHKARNRNKRNSDTIIGPANVEELFNKKYDFVSDINWYLPQFEGSVFSTSRWGIPRLQGMKEALNDCKAQLGEFDLNEWSQHTRMTDRAGNVFFKLKKSVRPDFLTQAWCKFYEIASSYNIVCKLALTSNKLNSVHLCEAPGAFVSALNHHLRLNHPQITWNWMASSLNPEYEGNNMCQMIPDKRLIKCTRPNWFFGEDKTGNIISYRNHLAIVQKAKQLGEVFLVTADGSIDCMYDPGAQENIVEHLLYCETITALSILSVGGSYVLKMFTSFEDSSINLLFLLRQSFTSVHLFKPCTSKSGNSEVYVVCLEYLGHHFIADIWPDLMKHYEKPDHEKSMFTLSDIPVEFIEQIENSSNIFMTKQIDTINRNILCFNNLSDTQRRKVHKLKEEIAEHYVSKYRVEPLEDEHMLMHGAKVDHYNKRCVNSSAPLLKIKAQTFLFGKLTLGTLVCEFEIGKQFETVYYSEYCDITFLKTLRNIDLSLTNPSTYTDKIDTDIDYKKLHIKYDHDNRVYVNNLFVGIKSLLNDLRVGDNIVLLGALFLTRYEVGLLHLLVGTFDTVDYCYEGAIVLRGFTQSNVLVLYEEIAHKISALSADKSTDYTVAILSVLPYTFLENSTFYANVQIYNNSFLRLLH